ncbi:MAG: hypothetical protein APR63_04290 [Desulfuromonas sp. SDB]|nr:MAG: hypothetical protein APR63_04290 [Desulfuromonas sp. SDB]
MDKIIGMRREDKGLWEKRAPLIPEDVEKLTAQGYKIMVQPSEYRIFPEHQYKKAGAQIVDDLSPADIILGIKEVKPELLLEDKVYLFFSHTIKGQSYNMPMLKKILSKKITLIDYELISNTKGQRLIFFGHYAGLAGAIDTLWGLGQRLAYLGMNSPLIEVKRAWEYDNLNQAKQHIHHIGNKIAEGGISDNLKPLIIAFVGYGHVSEGAQEIISLLPEIRVKPEAILESPDSWSDHHFITTVFHEYDLVENINNPGEFDLQEYYDYPQKYRGVFDKYLDKLNVIINGSYWDERYPRLVTREQVIRLYQQPEPKLQVIGDISCDIEGGIEINTKVTSADNPVYVFDTQLQKTVDGVKGHGPVVLANDILPSELPVESSGAFSHVLVNLIPDLVKVDYQKKLEELSLSDQLKKAVIAHQGLLTSPYDHLREYLPEENV